MIGVFAAMQSEVEACPASLRAAAQREVGRFTVFEGESGFVCRTGIGPIAGEATRLTVEELSPRVVLSVGTCGGLNGELDSGDVVVCSHVHEWRDSEAGELEALAADRRLLSTAVDAAASAGIAARTGGSVSVDTPAWGPEEKRKLRDWMGHDIVEMESYWIGRAAAQSGLPFLTVRVITDGYDASLPKIPGLFRPDGTMDTEKLLEHTREHPEVIPMLAEMRDRSERALANLGRLLDALVPALARVLP